MSTIEVHGNGSNAEMTPSGDDRRRTSRRSWMSTIRFVLLCLVIWLGLRMAAPSYAIEGESMWPSLHDGGRVIINSAYRFQSAHHGDVVIFHPPFNSDKPFIKRIIGIAGDTIEIRDGNVYRNGILLDEPYINGARTTCYYEPNCSLIVPEGTVYVLGDNRPNSSDSRVFGPVPEDNIVGDVLFSFWPLEDIR